MLYRSNDIKGRELAASDGDAGKISDVFFDDERWTVRYLVVDTGTWLNSRQMLISPASLPAGPSDDDEHIRTNLTRKQIEDSPPVDTHQPVSRRHEMEQAIYYGYPVYWMGAGLWGGAALPYREDPAVPGTDVVRGTEQDRETPPEDVHLRSCSEVVGYHIQASDGEIGHVEDFLVDPQSWQIRRLLIDTRNWWPGKHVQISPSSIGSVDWAERKVHVALSREQIKAAPEGAD
jgi:uncharacterized protein YrrD